MPALLPDELDQTIKRGNPNAVAPASHSSDNETCDIIPASVSQDENHTRSQFAGGGALSGGADDLPPPTQTPPPSANLLPVVPGYVLSRELARGGMGVVFVARDRVLNREVAVKTLLPGSAANPTAFRRFVTEARITARLSHPCIPPVYALGTFPDGRPFLAMKLIKGRTLAAVLAARASRAVDGDEEMEMTGLHAPGLLQVFEQICQAVGYAHSEDVIHRDLKPANVMLGAFGEVQVMDWGLAREIGRAAAASSGESPALPEAPAGGSEDTGIHLQDDTEQSRLGEALGTPAFMPPEQARGDWDNVDARADVFALGGILCTILTGQPPYAGRTLLEIIRRAATADLGEAFARLDGCGADPALIGLAKRCLSPKADDRLPHGMAIVASLQAHRWELEERARAASRTPPRPRVRIGGGQAAGALKGPPPEPRPVSAPDDRTR